MTAGFQGFSDDSSIRRFADFFTVRNMAPAMGWCWRMAPDQIPVLLLLTALAGAFAGAGFTVLRCDLPFRQARPYGPPRPGDAERDRDGLRNAVAALRKLGCGRMFLGGHSYGGRQATMLCAAEPDLVAGLLLLSYPLHPPRKPAQLRVQHLPDLRVPALFVHGTRDPFGSIEEMEAAVKMIPAKTELLNVDGAGHDLGFKGKAVRDEVVEEIVHCVFWVFREDES